DSCKNLILNSCGFYRSCVEATVGCGSRGYALQHGEKMCTKYMNTGNRLSAAGQIWV
ncbi:hypothetical protein CC78DRAFT_433455, partial [Lojkania enalia]